MRVRADLLSGTSEARLELLTTIRPAPESGVSRRSILAAVVADDATPAERFAVSGATAALALLAGAAGWMSLPVLEVSLGIGAILVGGARTARASVQALFRRALEINTLMILAAVGSAAIGRWHEGAVLLVLFTLSDAMEQYITRRTHRSIRALESLRPTNARRVIDGMEQLTPIDQLATQDHVRVRPGERLPVDGVVVDGAGAVDEAILTGESIPVEKRPGDDVIAGAFNVDGSLLIRVTRVAADSLIARVIALVESAQERKTDAERAIARWQSPYVAFVLLATVLAGVTTAALGASALSAWYAAIVLLVAASPCAVVLATPAATLAAITRAARLGVLFKGGSSLEALARVDAVALDKTGTLTRGKPAVVRVTPAGSSDEHSLLAVAAALESHSEHPLARAIVDAARKRGIEPPGCEEFRNEAGLGVVGVVDGRPAAVGRSELIRRMSRRAADVAAPTSGPDDGAVTMVHVWREGGPAGVIGLADEVRPDARRAVERLHHLALRVTMLTGDNDATARAVASRLGIDDVHAGLLPADKLAHIDAMRRGGSAVAMIGDGVNDAPALAAANVGIAMGGGGVDVALESADVVLVRDDLPRVADAIRLSRRARRVIRQSLALAFASIGVLVVCTALGWLTLPIAVVGHEGTTVMVILNGLRLLAYSPDRSAEPAGGSAAG